MLTQWSTLDDIVFENRNKAYGAYELRMHYRATVWRSFLITCLFLMVLFSFLKWLSNLPAAKMTTICTFEVSNTFQNLVKNKITPLEKPQTPQEKTAGAVSPDKIEPVPDNQPVTNVHVSTNVLSPGDGSTPEEFQPVQPDPEPTPPVKEAIVEKEKPVVEIVDVADVNAEFMGGTKALIAYLQANLKYPKPAERNSIEGRVFIQFIVGVDGQISQIHLLKGIGFGCDEEALKVINAMPAWKPAVKNGHKVNQRYTLPIMFKLD